MKKSESNTDYATCLSGVLVVLGVFSYMCLHMQMQVVELLTVLSVSNELEWMWKKAACPAFR
jgi:hypothetical protein